MLEQLLLLKGAAGQLHESLNEGTWLMRRFLCESRVWPRKTTEDCYTVADAEFLEGGFCHNSVHEIFETTPIFDRFGEKLLVLPVN